MMHHVEECEADCPYCGEFITLLVDTSEVLQCYVEDCEVCCRPIVVDVHMNDGRVVLWLKREDE